VLGVFRGRADRSPAEILEACDVATRSTRGAAATVARIDLAKGLLTIAAVGNVTPWLIEAKQRQLVTQHGTLGHAMPRVREEQYAWEPGAMLVVSSDGLKTRWTLDGHPGLSSRHPATISSVLWRDFARGKDDATVVVARGAR
jgi:hypothetical protein